MITFDTNKLVTQELSHNEVMLYVSLLEHGKSPAGKLSEITKIKRPTVYLTLDNLHKKGFVSIVNEGKIKRYEANDPEKLREFFAEKIQILNKEMPRLKWLSNRLSDKPSVRYFRGIEGAKSAYIETLEEPKTTIRSVGSVEDAEKIFGERWIKRYLKNRKKKKIKMSSILTKTLLSKKITRDDKEQLRESKLIKSDLLPKNVELNVSGHKIMFSSYGEEPLGIIIENKELAKILAYLFDQSYKSIK